MNEVDMLILSRLRNGTLKVDPNTGEVFSSLANGYKITGWVKLNGTMNEGYIQFSLNLNNKMKTVNAHKVIWLSANPDIPDGMVIDHINHIRDDNRLENLRLLTRHDNSIENGILIMNDAINIRKLYSTNKYNQSEIARIYKVSQFAISSILRNRTHYDPFYVPVISKDNRVGECNHLAKLTESDIVDIRNMYINDHLSYNNIAKIYNVDRSTISAIIKRQTWKHVK